MMSQSELSNLIWSVADLLRGDYRQSEYGRVVLAFARLRRLEIAQLPTMCCICLSPRGDFDSCAMLVQKSTFRAGSNGFGSINVVKEPH